MNSGVFSPNGEDAVLQTGKQDLAIVRLKSKGPLQKLTLKDSKDYERPRFLSDGAGIFAFSPKEHLLRVWRTADGDVLRSIPLNTKLGYGARAEITSDGRYIVVCDGSTYESIDTTSFESTGLQASSLKYYRNWRLQPNVGLVIQFDRLKWGIFDLKNGQSSIVSVHADWPITYATSYAVDTFTFSKDAKSLATEILYESWEHKNVYETDSSGRVTTKTKADRVTNHIVYLMPLNGGKEFAFHDCNFLGFSQDSRYFFLKRVRSDQLEVHDSATGELVNELNFSTSGVQLGRFSIIKKLDFFPNGTDIAITYRENERAPIKVAIIKIVETRPW